MPPKQRESICSIIKSMALKTTELCSHISEVRTSSSSIQVPAKCIISIFIQKQIQLSSLTIKLTIIIDLASTKGKNITEIRQFDQVITILINNENKY